jgi:5-(carboxyamino)imidazole ribonucleotide synthase
MSDGALLPGSTLGILGGGQLGRMVALEARRMGYRTVVLDPGADSPAAQVCDEAITAPLDDPDAVHALGSRCDVVTLEWENADLPAVETLARMVPVRPGPGVLAAAQHRVREKEAARAAGLSTAEYRAITSLADLRAALESVGTPAVLKTCRGGYDGHGQVRIRSAAEAEAAFRQLGGREPELILERWIDFEREVSVITARGASGEVRSFPVAENDHHDGILEATRVPAGISAALANEARRTAEAFAESLDVVGLLAVEMFVTRDGRLLVNEIAPRPHNSGHCTWEACPTSQFEQLIRAVCGLPLGATDLLRPAAMINLLGHETGTGLGLPSVAEALVHPGLALHLYGKREARPRRKMGHLTVLADSAEEALETARRAKREMMRGYAAE